MSTDSSSYPIRARIVTIALIAALGALALGATACSSSTTPTASDTAASSTESNAGSATTAPSDTTGSSTAESGSSSAAKGEAFDPVTKLVIKDTVKGTGATAKNGDQATVDYTGWLPDGTVFDSSVGKQPFKFVVGGGQVIEGWDKGVAGMKVGGTRILYIPADLGYGAQGYPPVIPGNSSLKFEVKLISVAKPQ